MNLFLILRVVKLFLLKSLQPLAGRETAITIRTMIFTNKSTADRSLLTY